MLVQGKRLFDEVASSLSGASATLLIHSDAGAVGIIDAMGSRTEMLDAHLDLIMNATAGRTVLFPTFNYDYCRTGNYIVASDPSQVGALSEHARLRHPGCRTQTPVFNFVQLGEPRVSASPLVNAFDSDSTFGELARLQATVVFYGAPFATNTFLHCVEEYRQVGYRYLKEFPGRVWVDGQPIASKLLYRVRPLIAGALEYDWPRLIEDLRAESLLHSAPVGRGVMHSYRADRLLQFWGERLASNELYLLTEGARAMVQRLYREYGYPLTYESMAKAEASGVA